MVTQIAQVNVTPLEGGAGFQVKCDACWKRGPDGTRISTFRHIRPTRPQADALANEHQRSHVQPNYRDEDWL